MLRFWSKALLASAAGVFCTSVDAAVLFSDNFNRADDVNIDASLSGVTNNTGTALPVDGVYSQPFLDPTNETTGFDGDPGNAGGAQIGGQLLQLAVGPGTSNAVVNHNFTNAEILAAGGFSVSLDVLGYANSGEGFGGAFAVGMTQAEALSASDAFNGDQTLAKMTNAFPTQFTRTVSDFWVGLRGKGDGELAWGNGPVPVSDPSFKMVDVDAKTGTISADFRFDSFAAGSAVSVSVYYNGDLKGTGSFTWSDDDANYIGIDARDAQAVSLDNFNIRTIPEPASLALVGLACGLGAARRRRG